MSGSGSGGGDGGSGGGDGGTNAVPVANAGDDQTVGPRQNVTLDGSGSTDSDGQLVRFLWTQILSRKVTINNADSAVASFVSPRVRRGQTRTLVFDLEVVDAQGASATDQVTVVVTR